jgi:LPXTG-motif cell wall-anchored protein
MEPVIDLLTAIRSGDSDLRRVRRGARLLAFFVITTLGVAVFMPALAAGHAGEVHTEPAPKAEKAAVPPKDGKRAGSREAETATGDRAGDKRGAMPSGEGGSNDGAASQVSAETPPPPEVPQSNPGFHFLALGLVALLAAGFVVLRRRRAFG